MVAVFSRKRLGRADLSWLRVFADHAAVAIANTRAYAEIAELKRNSNANATTCAMRSEVRCIPCKWSQRVRPMRRVLEEVRAVARTPSTVLITGESGVGKELIASAIHDLSPRAQYPLVR